MIKITDKAIKEIASHLESGNQCFYHLETGEIEFIPDFDHNIYAESEMWQELIDKLDADSTKYIKFSQMSSRESFGMMEAFVLEVDDLKLADRLSYDLQRPKPFSNFKNTIDYSGDYRKKWFDFKKQYYIHYVKDHINMLDREKVD